MSDAAQKKASKPTKPAEHPKYSDMVLAALAALKDRTGSSRQAIKKYIEANYKVKENCKTHLKTALKRMSDRKDIIHTKGIGASGSFKLNKELSVKPKKLVVKKPAAKKPVAKKPAAKKPSAKKPAAKKAAAKPKAATAKKAVAKKAAAKPAAKKPARKSVAKKPAAKKPAAKKSPARKPAAKKAAKPAARKPKGKSPRKK